MTTDELILHSIIAKSAVTAPWALTGTAPDELEGLPPAIRRRVQIVKTAHALLDQIPESIKDPLMHNRTLQTGLVSALLGGGLTAASGRKPRESTGGKVLRVLRNAAITGGLGAGAVAMAGQGAKDIATALPAGDVDPITAATHSTGLRTLLGIGGGVGTLSTGKNGLLGKGIEESALQRLRNDFSHDHPLAPDLGVAQGGRMTEAGSHVSAAPADSLLTRLRSKLPSWGSDPADELHSPKLRDAARNRFAKALDGTSFTATGTTEADKLKQVLSATDKHFSGQGENYARIFAGDEMLGLGRNGRAPSEVLADINRAGINYARTPHGQLGLTAARWADRLGGQKRWAGNLAKGIGGAAAGIFAPEIIHAGLGLLPSFGGNSEN